MSEAVHRSQADVLRCKLAGPSLEEEGAVTRTLSPTPTPSAGSSKSKGEKMTQRLLSVDKAKRLHFISVPAVQSLGKIDQGKRWCTYSQQFRSGVGVE